jgi:uncharacterized membrane protein YfcA
VTIELAFLLFALVVVAAYTVQTATGFGAMLVCVTLGAQLIGLEEVIRLMVPLSFLQTSYIVIRHRDGIDWSLLLKRVLPLMGVGMALAFLLLTKVGGPWLGLAFGWMVLALSARDLHHLRFANAALDKPISRPASMAALVGAGVIHGIYASGGPMLVYAIGREGLTKGTMTERSRSTSYCSSRPFRWASCWVSGCTTRSTSAASRRRCWCFSSLLQSRYSAQLL